MPLDVILNNDFEPSFYEGDIDTGECTQEYMRLMLLSEKGHFRETPFWGASVYSLINNEGSANSFLAEVQRNVELDNARVLSLNYNHKTEKLNLKVKYK